MTGSFAATPPDPLSPPDPARWDRLDSTFFCNQAHFSPDHVDPLPGGGVALRVDAQPKGDRAFQAGSIATRDVPEAAFRYGRFEVELKATRGDGLITAFFLYRFDPWQEIDAEFLGKDTRKLLINVFYNPGEPGDLYNYGFRGTPVLVDLGFDAADAFHRYAIEWDPHEIRWFVDGELVHVRPEGRPTPIPHLPMRFHLNAWPICSEELAGKLDPARLPAQAEVRSVTLSPWVPPIGWNPAGGDWRDRAAWITHGAAGTP